jgi:hypothetical protein
MPPQGEVAARKSPLATIDGRVSEGSARSPKYQKIKGTIDVTSASEANPNQMAAVKPSRMHIGLLPGTLNLNAMNGDWIDEFISAVRTRQKHRKCRRSMHYKLERQS